MTRYIVCTLFLTVLAITACTPSVGPTQNPTPQTAVSAKATVMSPANTTLPTSELSRFMSDQQMLRNPDAANRAMREFTEWARNASGLRVQLGAQADEIFRVADQAEATAVQEILRQTQPNSKPPGRPALLPPRLNRSIALDPLGSWVGIFQLLLSPMHDVGSYPSSDAEPAIFDKDPSEGVHVHIKMKTKIMGSRVEGDVEMTIRVEKDGKTFEEKASGKFSMNVCPDAQGLVPMDASFQNGNGSGGGGINMGFSIHAIGHVDDEGNLASIEEEIQAEMSMQTVGSGTIGTAGPTSARVNLRNIVEGTDNKVSFPGRTTISEFEKGVALNVGGLAINTAYMAFKAGGAESIWQNGSCVAIVVPEGRQQQVGTGSETSFTAMVQHKIEGTDLTVPVVATLDSGAVSVTPSNTKVPAPATFRYKAPDKSGMDATVELISRSCRGIGKLTVFFNTEDLYYRVDTEIGDPKVKLSGNICALDKPFTLKANGPNAAGGQYVGDFMFTPTGKTGGSLKYAATSCIPGYACAKLSASCTYQLVGVTDGKLILMMPACNGTSEVKGAVGVYGSPAWQIELQPDTGTCWE